MPGPYLHFLLSKSALSYFDSPLKEILSEGKDFFITGSLAPDLPYASLADDDLILNNRCFVADLLHTSKTNRIIFHLAGYIRLNFKTLTKAHSISLFSFLAGYISHYLADGIMHPYIRDKAGDYESNKEAHRRLEMKLDAAGFYLLSRKSVVLTSSPLIQCLEKVKVSKDSYILFKLFSAAINNIYSLTLDSSEIQNWITGFCHILNYTSGTNARILSKLGVFNSYLYPEISDLLPEINDISILTKPVDRQENFIMKGKVLFFEDCLPVFYRKFVPLIRNLFLYIYENGRLNENEIPGINLDNGRSLADPRNLNDTPPLWLD